MANVILSNQKLGTDTLMSFPSKFDGKCKDCGVQHKAGVNIAKNSNDNWCKNGLKCTATNVPKPKKTPEAKSSTRIKDASFIEEQIKQLQDIEKIVIANMESNPNVQKVGMYVKEIYKQLKKKERNSS